MNRLLVMLLGLCLVPAAKAQIDVTLEYVGQFGEFGFYQPSFPANRVPPTGFKSPTGVAFQGSNRLIIADRGNLKLQSCSPDGTDCFWLGNDGSGRRNMQGTFDLPHGVAINRQGLIAVADEDNHWVQLCSTTGTCKFRGDQGSQDALPSSALGRWAYPQDVAVASDDRIYGLDTGNDRVQILNSVTLNFEKTFMSSGSALGQINGARGIALDAEDRVIIADTGNHRIQLCDFNANCTGFGRLGTAPGEFNEPVGVDVDELGRIWVADTGNNRVQACSYDGDCVSFGRAGSGDFEFDAPHDISVHPTGQVAVVDTNNNRIQRFVTEASFVPNAGLNDAWFNPETAGQGFFFTIYPELGKLFLANFTFDTERPGETTPSVLGDPGHRWLTAIGDINGSTVNLDVTLSSGGVFDRAQPVVENQENYGTMTLELLGCDLARLEYVLPGPLRGTIVLERVVDDNTALCEALSAP